MIKIRERKGLLALLALLFIFAACKGESPTAPPTSTGGGSGGNVTPPTAATLTLSASNLNPLVTSTTVITATATQNGQPVTNGTAVEFKTTAGTFSETQDVTAIRTTTNGIATVTLTNSAAGVAVVTAALTNVAKSITVTFVAVPVVPPPVSTTPTITAITPAFGRPQGGETVTITGTNFHSPVRVVFDFGSGVTKDAFVSSVTATSIQVITPQVDLVTAQTKAATILVFVDPGTASEVKATAATPFTYRADVLTPVVQAVTPSSGPVEGGTRVTIIGNGFQAPMQVQFGSISGNTWQDAQIVSIAFNQIIVLTPDARSTSPNGGATVTGPVDMRLRNINSNTVTDAANAFRFTPKAQVTAMGPTQGPATGGTRVTIDGVGFTDPMAIVIGGVAALPIKISGTQIIAITAPALITSCANLTNPSTVTNIDNGDQAIALPFTYILAKPTIASISNPASPGGPVTIVVNDPGQGAVQFTFGGKGGFISSAVPDPSGRFTTYTVNLPPAGAFAFPQVPCVVGGVTGTMNKPLTVDVVFTNLLSQCTVTSAGGLQIDPPDVSCQLPPPAFATISPASPICATIPGTISIAGGTATTTFTVSNTGGQPLQLTSVTVTPQGPGTLAGEFTVTPPASTTVAPGASATFTVNFDPSTVGSKHVDITVGTSDAAHPTLSTCVNATAGP
jgi:hypothetical protein